MDQISLCCQGGGYIYSGFFGIEGTQSCQMIVVNKIDFAILIPCFSLYRLLYHNTIDYVANKQQEFIFHSSEPGKSKIKALLDLKCLLKVCFLCSCSVLI